MREYTFHNATLECVVGDIAAQGDMEAVVNAANAQLQIGGGVAGALHRAAGPGLAQECAPLAPIRPGEAVITSGHELPNAYVIHVLGPVYGVDEPAAGLLAACHEQAIRLAVRERIDSIAFPAVSTGAFGYPAAEAAEIAVAALGRTLGQTGWPTHVRFVLFDDATRAIYEKALAAHAA